ncbi:inorganic phosphate transporter [Megalodesulfovibrio gigas]|uniref:Phosphate transporter n=1 Tax=Megalodesulfovibrio gigas (strain ATCC 19364 / DSM 1382 / NCIMB 9332 / VKM B-1759) TaxID=1121448 RepID=T2GBD8_MEGG1|nr:inorganic phosphate transporter [Megalodesulfovibrio gigas]AGW13905.1 putative phosphate transporter [Megalodesulfovibrio gigas DSM 1382 = ATCC 19364]
MTFYEIFIVLAMLAGFLMAFNLGANDVANAMASSVGAKAITVRQALLIAGVLNFAGAVLLGSHVTATISKGIINIDMISDPKILVLGMFAALLSAALWVLAATLTGLPVSSTHSIVGSILGFGLVAGGPDIVNWLKMVGIVISWIISPFFGGLLGFVVFSLIRKKIFHHPQIIPQARRWAPIWIAITASLVVFSLMYKTPAGKALTWAAEIKLLVALGISALAWYVGRYFVIIWCRNLSACYAGVETIFSRMQVGTACFVALTQGANDVANAIGPVAAVYMVARDHSLASQVEVPIWLLMIGGGGIALGIALLGRRVMVTMGEKITELNNSRGFSVEFGAATTVLGASVLGLPVSTTHAAVGSVVGVGLARGFGAVDFRILFKIVLYWVLTVPVAAFTCIVIFQLLRWMIL